ncbi:MAG: protein translocase subunit SecF [bacterium]|nr:protein translocase subunit SecF [Deltaproteobacteria bacterium]MCP4906074.1 protein translocase subunit SecF [bacterium]
MNGIKVGLDFAGGTEVQLLFGEGTSVDESALREVARAAGFVDASVVRFGEVEEREFLIKFTDASGVAPPDEEIPDGLAANTQVMLLEAAIQGALGDFTEQRVEFVGARVGAELREDGTKALLYSAIAILAYVAFRFSSRFAPGAVVAVVHDLTITAGILVMMGEEFDLQILAAMLAILGYSLNDTIIIYDRIRENMQLHTAVDLEDVLNTSVNQTLSRTVLTSLTTTLALLSLYFLGGEVIQPFAKTMLIGVIVGTYSSVFIASPLLLFLERRYGDRDKQDGRKGTGVNKAVRA